MRKYQRHGYKIVTVLKEDVYKKIITTKHQFSHINLKSITITFLLILIAVHIGELFLNMHIFSVILAQAEGT